MVKKYTFILGILFLFLGQFSLYSAQYKGNLAQKVYCNYTLENNSKKVDNIVKIENLKDEKDDFTEKYTVIEDKLMDKKRAIFLLVMVADKGRNRIAKFFFMNKNPNLEKGAISKVERLFRCHAIWNNNPKTDCHLIFELLGWLAQEKQSVTPIFIHASSPLCTTCHAIVLNLFNLNLLMNEGGCCGGLFPDFNHIPPFAQKYLKNHLTLAFAEKIIAPKIRLVCELQRGYHLTNLQKDNVGLRKANKDLKNNLHKQKKALSLKNQQIKMLQQQIVHKGAPQNAPICPDLLVNDQGILNFQKHIKAISKAKSKSSFSLNT